MNGLTICQPYAHLIAIGKKWVENRTWGTAYRGLLAIHAGISRDYLGPNDLDRYPNMAFGAIVGIALLSECLTYGIIMDWARHNERFAEILAHKHTEGPYCWLLEYALPLAVPIRCKGMQRLWPVPPTINAKLETTWSAAR